MNEFNYIYCCLLCFYSVVFFLIRFDSHPSTMFQYKNVACGVSFICLIMYVFVWNFFSFFNCIDSYDSFFFVSLETTIANYQSMGKIYFFLISHLFRFFYSIMAWHQFLGICNCYYNWVKKIELNYNELRWIAQLTL